jgi:hypothetical protein
MAKRYGYLGVPFAGMEWVAWLYRELVVKSRHGRSAAEDIPGLGRM